MNRKRGDKNRKTDYGLFLWIVNEITSYVIHYKINKRKTNCTEYIARYKVKWWIVREEIGTRVDTRANHKIPPVFFRIVNYFTSVFTLSVDIFYRYIQDDIINEQKMNCKQGEIRNKKRTWD